MAGLLYDGHVVSGPSMLVVNVMGTEARVERCAWWGTATAARECSRSLAERGWRPHGPTASWISTCRRRSRAASSTWSASWKVQGALDVRPHHAMLAAYTFLLDGYGSPTARLIGRLPVRRCQPGRRAQGGRRRRRRRRRHQEGGRREAQPRRHGGTGLRWLLAAWTKAVADFAFGGIVRADGRGRAGVPTQAEDGPLRQAGWEGARRQKEPSDQEQRRQEQVMA